MADNDKTSILDLLAILLVAFGIYVLSEDSLSILGLAMVLFGMLALCIKEKE